MKGNNFNEPYNINIKGSSALKQVSYKTLSIAQGGYWKQMAVPQEKLLDRNM